MKQIPRRGLVVVVLVLVLLVGLGYFADRWWDGPSPESEAQKYFDEQAPGVVRVIDCEYAEDPERSVFYMYRCVLRSDGVLPHPPGRPGIGTVKPGRRGYCFSIPRASGWFHRFDSDASPYYPADEVDDCM